MSKNSIFKKNNSIILDIEIQNKMADDQVLDQVNGKIWEKLWSSKEISNNSLNWSLAGDAGVKFFEY